MSSLFHYNVKGNIKKTKMEICFWGKGNVGFTISKFLPFLHFNIKRNLWRGPIIYAWNHKKKLRWKIKFILGGEERELHGLHDLKFPFFFFFISTWKREFLGTPIIYAWNILKQKFLGKTKNKKKNTKVEFCFSGIGVLVMGAGVFDDG
jgi:hypothetical protein